MIKLLRAGFRRYIKSNILVLAVTATLAIAIYDGLMARRFYFEDFYVIVFLIIDAVMVSLLVGREHDEGIFRNKVVSGHTKGNIYFAELILGIVIAAFLYLVFSVVFLCVNFYIVGYAPIDISVKIFLNGLLASAYTTVIFVTVGCLISHKAITAIVNILLILSLTVSAEAVNSALKRPEYLEKYDYEYTEIIDDEGKVFWQATPIEDSKHLVENPNYIKSPAREILCVFSRISPFTPIRESSNITQGWFGYDMQVSADSSNTFHSIWENNADFSVTKNENTALNISMVCMLAEVIAVSCVGYFCFRKKELK